MMMMMMLLAATATTATTNPTLPNTSRVASGVGTVVAVALLTATVLAVVWLFSTVRRHGRWIDSQED